jgi:hypothetical protein
MPEVFFTHVAVGRLTIAETDMTSTRINLPCAFGQGILLPGVIVYPGL